MKNEGAIRMIKRIILLLSFSLLGLFLLVIIVGGNRPRNYIGEARECQYNLGIIQDKLKEAGGKNLSIDELFYPEAIPVCPSGGTYRINSNGVPVCSYAKEKYYHSLEYEGHKVSEFEEIRMNQIKQELSAMKKLLQKQEEEEGQERTDIDSEKNDDRKADYKLENGEHLLLVDGRVIARQKVLENSLRDFMELPMFHSFSGDRNAYLYSTWEDGTRVLHLVHDDGKQENFKLEGDVDYGFARFVNDTKKIAYITTNPATGKNYISFHGEKVSAELDKIYSDFIFNEEESKVLYLGVNTVDGQFYFGKKVYSPPKYKYCCLGINKTLHSFKTSFEYGTEDEIPIDDKNRKIYMLGLGPKGKHCYCIHEQRKENIKGDSNESTFWKDLGKVDFSIIMNGKKEKSYLAVSQPVFSSDDKYYAYWGIEKSRTVLIINGEECYSTLCESVFNYIDDFPIPPDPYRIPKGKYFNLRWKSDLKFIDKEHLCFSLENDDKKERVIYRVEEGESSLIGSFESP